MAQNIPTTDEKLTGEGLLSIKGNRITLEAGDIIRYWDAMNQDGPDYEVIEVLDKGVLIECQMLWGMRAGRRYTQTFFGYGWGLVNG